MRANARSNSAWSLARASFTSRPIAGRSSFGTEPICFMSAVNSPFGPDVARLGGLELGARLERGQLHGRFGQEGGEFFLHR